MRVVHHPPEVIAAGPVELRRAVAEDGMARALSAAVVESLDRLGPWLAWATPEAATPETQRKRLDGLTSQWESGAPFDYVLSRPGERACVGAASLMGRIGGGGLEIGYWVHVDHVGRGYATAAAGALTDAALALGSIDRVEIHCDEANQASAAISVRLDYRLVRTENKEIAAPAETGRNMVWVRTRAGSGRARR